MKHVLPSLLVVLGLAGGTAPATAGGADPAPPGAAPTADELKNPQWIADGRLRFASACSYCHGSEGTSGKVKSFKERPGWDPQAIHDVIAEGRVRAGNVMPSWKSSIPDADIWKLVAFVKSLTPADPASAAPPPQ
jgi:mono/diheme cytochrome c family protein